MAVEFENRVKILPEKMEDLRAILLHYQGVFDVFEKEIIDDVIDAYAWKKGLTSIELYDKDPETLSRFMKEVERFLFVKCSTELLDDGTLAYKIFVSRFKNLPEFAVKNDIGRDLVADLSGILFGYDLNNVIGYCLKGGRLKHLVRIDDDEINLEGI